MPNEPIIERAIYDGFRPDQRLTVDEWADSYRELSPKASAEPGRWRTSRTPYLREIMRRLSPSDPCQRVVFMKAAQVGATECGNNWIGYSIHHHPGPMLMVQPTGDMAKRVSKQRITPMIEATPVLYDRVARSRSRDSGNTIFAKEYLGGILMMAGSNSGAGLRSMPIRDLFLDEVDEYPGDVDGQGDPIIVAEKRTSTFARRKVFVVSTPTIKGLSRIEKEYLESDQRRYYVPCPECGAMDWMRWPNIRWETGKPDTAKLFCEGCGALINERFKGRMLHNGEWRATKPGDGITFGYHISALYSPAGWRSWVDIVREFLSAKEDHFRLKAWVNTVLGETWEDRGESAEPEHVIERAEAYDAEVPIGVGVLTAAVDVQGDRLEVAVKGWGHAEESWLIAYTVIPGDPGHDQVWRDLTTFLLTQFTHQSGHKMQIEITAIDSGGLHTERVYRYCQAMIQRRVYAVKGSAVPGMPIIGRPSTGNRFRIPLYIIGTDTAKDMIYSRLRIRNKGPGYMHLPDWTDMEYVHQLCAERAVIKYEKNRGAKRVYMKVRERNEALDLEVYALAALHTRGTQFVNGLEQRAAALNNEKPETARPAPQRRSGWINSWRS